MWCASVNSSLLIWKVCVCMVPVTEEFLWKYKPKGMCKILHFNLITRDPKEMLLMASNRKMNVSGCYHKLCPALSWRKSIHAVKNIGTTSRQHHAAQSFVTYISHPLTQLLCYFPQQSFHWIHPILGLFGMWDKLTLYYNQLGTWGLSFIYLIFLIECCFSLTLSPHVQILQNRTAKFSLPNCRGSLGK